MKLVIRVLNDRFGIEPGDMHRIAENSEWLAYSLYEVSKVIKREDLLGSLYKLKIRIKYGIKEELSSLVTLEGIGRIRARALYDAGLTNIGKVTNTSESRLSAIPKIGPTVAKKLKQQLRSHSIRHR